MQILTQDDTPLEAFGKGSSACFDPLLHAAEKVCLRNGFYQDSPIFPPSLPAPCKPIAADTPANRAKREGELAPQRRMSLKGLELLRVSVGLLTMHRSDYESKGQVVVFKFLSLHDGRMPQSSREPSKSNEGFGLERWRQDLNPRPLWELPEWHFYAGARLK